MTSISFTRYRSREVTSMLLAVSNATDSGGRKAYERGSQQKMSQCFHPLQRHKAFVRGRPTQAVCLYVLKIGR